ncbi:MAG: flagellar basal body-associated FliL family protein [Holosporales bacterium]
MSAEESPETQNPAEEGKEGEGKKKSSKLLLIIIIAVVVLGGGAAGFLFLTPMGKKMIGLDHDKKDAEKKPEQIVYYEMPELIVNLTTTGKRTPFLRVVMKFELPDQEAVKTMDLIKPRIIDSFQVYLRELRMDDLEGSAGVQRLREELLKRANALSAPVQVRDVLFETLLVQ